MWGADDGANPDARPEWRWDVALSFAGAQRDYAEQVARALKARGVRCFYDADEEIDLWGKYLAEELPGIYSEQAAAAVVFVSAEYMARDWTRVERRAALGRAVRERREYVLPARFDDTPLPGLLSGMVWVDLRGRAPEQFAAMITDKLAALGIGLPVSPTDAKSPPPLPELPSDTTAAKRPRLIHTLSGRTSSWRELLTPTWFVSAAFSPSERLLAGANTDRTVRLWDPATGEHLNTLAGHTGSVAAVAFSPDGRLLASGGSGDDPTVRLWDPANGEHLRTLGSRRTGQVFGMAFSPDGRLLATTGRGAVWLWDPATSENLRTLAGHTGPVEGVAFSPDGRLLASSGGHLERTVRLWDPATGEHLRTLADHNDLIIGLAFSPDGRLLAGHNGGGGTVRLWDPATGEHLRTLAGHSTGGGVPARPAGSGVAFSPDGRLLASSNGKTVRLWDPATGEHLRTLDGHSKGVIGVAFSADGQLLASCGLDNKLRVWEIPGTERQRNGQWL